MHGKDGFEFIRKKGHYLKNRRNEGATEMKRRKKK